MKKFNDLTVLKRNETVFVTNPSLSDKIDGYNRLKDNVLYIMDGGKNKVLMIESSVEGECKTTVACNLAALLGQNDKKVLLLDLDFHRTNVHRTMNVDNDCGISEYMLEQKKLDEVIKHTEYKNVDVLPCGGKIYNPSLVLISDRFNAMMQELRNSYDLIVVDTAPVLQASDYIHVSRYVDATIFLVIYGKTKKVQVRDAITELRKNKVNIIGTVFTCFDSKRAGSKKYYYHRYYKPVDTTKNK